MIRLFSASICAAALASCGQQTPTNEPAATPVAEAPAAQVHYAGNVTFRERLALPAGAQVIVELQDVSRADAPAIVLASQTIEAGPSPPYPFALAAPQAAVDAAQILTLRAQIRVGEALWFTSDTHVEAPKQGASGVEIATVRVAASP